MRQVNDRLSDSTVHMALRMSTVRLDGYALYIEDPTPSSSSVPVVVKCGRLQIAVKVREKKFLACQQNLFVNTQKHIGDT